MTTTALITGVTGQDGAWPKATRCTATTGTRTGMSTTSASLRTTRASSSSSLPTSSVSRCTSKGSGEKEVGVVSKVEGNKAKCKAGDVIVKVDLRYCRPTQVETVLGDPSKAKAKLGWEPAIAPSEPVQEMAKAIYASARRVSLVNWRAFTRTATTNSQTSQRRLSA